MLFFKNNKQATVSDEAVAEQVMAAVSAIRAADGNVDRLMGNYEPTSAPLNAVLTKLTDAEKSMVMRYLRRGSLAYSVPQRQAPATKAEALSLGRASRARNGLQFDYGRRDHGLGQLSWLSNGKSGETFELTNAELVSLLS